MLSVRLAKEAHFTQAAEDRKVPGLRSIIRLGEPRTHRVRAVSRHLALGTFGHASPRGLQDHSAWLTPGAATVRPSQVPMPKGIQILAHLPRGPPIEVSTATSDALRTAHSGQLYNAPNGGRVRSARM